MAFAPLLLAGAVGGGSAALGASAATAIGLASTAFSGFTAYQNAQYQAAVARNNQIQAVRNAGAESDAAQQEQLRSDLEYAQLRGEQLSTQAVSGLDLLSRSQIQTRQLTERTRERAATDIRTEGATRAQGRLTEAANFGAQRQAAKMEGYDAIGGTLLSMGRTTLGDTKLKKSLVSGAKSVRNSLFG